MRSAIQARRPRRRPARAGIRRGRAPARKLLAGTPRPSEVRTETPPRASPAVPGPGRPRPGAGQDSCSHRPQGDRVRTGEGQPPPRVAELSPLPRGGKALPEHARRLSARQATPRETGPPSRGAGAAPRRPVDVVQRSRLEFAAAFAGGRLPGGQETRAGESTEGAAVQAAPQGERALALEEVERPAEPTGVNPRSGAASSRVMEGRGHRPPRPEKRRPGAGVGSSDSVHRRARNGESGWGQPVGRVARPRG